MGAINHLNSDIFQKYQSLAGDRTFNAIEKASRKTGVDFAYLLEKAGAESNFDTDVKAKTSSATGLYQFIEQTWLQTVAKHGFKHGLGQAAQNIKITPKGRAIVSDRDVKQQILDLRKNPEIAANMAAEFAKDNKNYLEAKTDTDIGSTEMYLAHFLGAGSASKFINAMDDSGSKTAAQLFPAAAKANQGVFYNKDGSHRSLDQVYAFFDKKFSDEQIAPSPQQNSPSNRIPGDFDIASVADITDVFDASDVFLNHDTQSSRDNDVFYGGFASANTLSNTQDLYKVTSEIDVMLLSDMISRWTHEDASRSYQNAQRAKNTGFGQINPS